MLFNWRTRPLQKRLAPPESTASSSVCENLVRRKRAGNSSRSKYWPLAGCIAPSEAPERPVPYTKVDCVGGAEDEEDDEVEGEDDC